MVVLNPNIHKSTKLYKTFAVRFSEDKTEASVKQKNLKNLSKKVMQKAWKMYEQGVNKYIQQEFVAKGFRAIDFEVQDYFKQCLRLAWLSVKSSKQFKQLDQINLFN